jgi:hypothetical protein
VLVIPTRTLNAGWSAKLVVTSWSAVGGWVGGPWRTLGKIPSGANTVTVNANRYLNATNTIAYRVTLKRTKTQWNPVTTTSVRCRDLQAPICRSG